MCCTLGPFPVLLMRLFVRFSIRCCCRRFGSFTVLGGRVGEVGGLRGENTHNTFVGCVARIHSCFVFMLCIHDLCSCAMTLTPCPPTLSACSIILVCYVGHFSLTCSCYSKMYHNHNTTTPQPHHPSPHPLCSSLGPRPRVF